MWETLAVAAVALGAGWMLRAGEVRHLRAEVRSATDRLVGAWHEGATVPSRGDVVEPEPQVPVEIPALVEEAILNYDTAGQRVYRARAERVARLYPHLPLDEMLARVFTEPAL